MMHLLRLLMSWSVRRILLFIVVVAAMVAFVKVKEAYDSLPVLANEIETLQHQQALLEAEARGQATQAEAALAEIGRLEQHALQRRLARVRSDAAALDVERLSKSGFALQVVRGNSDAIARDLSAAFRLQLLRREEAVIVARLDMILRGSRVQGLRQRIAGLDAQITATERRITTIEQRFPVLSKVEKVPLIRRLEGPWRELRSARRDLGALRSQRAQAAAAHQAWQASLARSRNAYEQRSAAMRTLQAPVEALRERIAQRRGAGSSS